MSRNGVPSTRPRLTTRSGLALDHEAPPIAAWRRQVGRLVEVDRASEDGRGGRRPGSAPPRSSRVHAGGRRHRSAPVVVGIRGDPTRARPASAKGPQGGGRSRSPSMATPQGRRERRATLASFGLWRSLVARSVRVGEVAGSNPVSPIIESPAPLCIAVQTALLSGPGRRMLGRAERCRGRVSRSS